MKNFFLNLALAVLILGSTSSLFGEDLTKTFKVGVVLHLTGDLAMVSAAFREGIEVAVEEVNKSQSKFKIEIIVEDAQNNPKISNTVVQKLISSDQVDALILSSYLDAMSSGPLIEKAHMPSIVIWDSNPEIDDAGEYIFSIGPWTPSAGERAAQFSKDVLHARSAVIVTNSDSWSEAVGDYFSKDFERNGGKILDRVLLNATETDFRSIIAKIRKAAPDIVYTPLVFNLVPFYSQLKQLQLPAKVVTSDIIAEEHISKAPAVFEGIYQTGIVDPKSLKYGHLSSLYKAKFQRDITLPWFVAVGYDSVGLFNTAASVSGLEKDSLKRALYNIKNYKGASDTISISEKGSSPQYEHMFQIKNQKLVLVDHSEVTTVFSGRLAPERESPQRAIMPELPTFEGEYKGYRYVGTFENSADGSFDLYFNKNLNCSGEIQVEGRVVNSSFNHCKTPGQAKCSYSARQLFVKTIKCVR